MCLGVPMRICELADGWAHGVDRDGQTRRVSTLLLDRVNVNDWVLVHIDTAMRILDEAEAKQIANALEAITAAMQGEDFDHLFADLIDREPQLPAALRPPSEQEEKSP